jgi:hypothetical protein
LGYGLAVIGAGLGAALVLGPLAVTLLRRPALGSASTARGR